MPLKGRGLGIAAPTIDRSGQPLLGGMVLSRLFYSQKGLIQLNKQLDRNIKTMRGAEVRLLNQKFHASSSGRQNLGAVSSDFQSRPSL